LVLRTDIGNGKALQPTLLSYTPNCPGSPKSLPNHRINYSSLSLGVTNQGRILDIEELQWPSNKPDVPIHLSETDPQAANGEPKHLTVQPPIGRVTAISLSSKGDKLAWLINTQNAGPKIGFLRRILQRM